MPIDQSRSDWQFRADGNWPDCPIRDGKSRRAGPQSGLTCTIWGVARWRRLLGETVLIAYVATVTGAFAAFAAAAPASRNLMRNSAIRFVVRRALEFCRTVPDIVFALIFVAAFGLGALPGVLAIAIHTSGTLGKLFTEVVENIDMRPVEGLASTGGSWLAEVRFAATPQVLSNLVSYTLLRFEINVRGAAVIGIVGADDPLLKDGFERIAADYIRRGDRGRAALSCREIAGICGGSRVHSHPCDRVLAGHGSVGRAPDRRGHVAVLVVKDVGQLIARFPNEQDFDRGATAADRYPPSALVNSELPYRDIVFGIIGLAPLLAKRDSPSPCLIMIFAERLDSA